MLQAGDGPANILGGTGIVGLINMFKKTGPISLISPVTNTRRLSNSNIDFFTTHYLESQRRPSPAISFGVPTAARPSLVKGCEGGAVCCSPQAGRQAAARTGRIRSSGNGGGLGRGQPSRPGARPGWCGSTKRTGASPAAATVGGHLLMNFNFPD